MNRKPRTLHPLGLAFSLAGIFLKPFASVALPTEAKIEAKIQRHYRRKPRCSAAQQKRISAKRRNVRAFKAQQKRRAR